MGHTYHDSYGNIGHHQVNNKGHDYSLFEVRCGTCRELLFEFVHLMGRTSYHPWLLAIPDPNPSMGAQSWYKPAVQVVCRDGNHSFLPLLGDEDRNQVITSHPMTEEEFQDWSAWLRETK